MNKLSLKAKVFGNVIRYNANDFKKQIDRFKRANEGKEIEIVFLPAFSAEYHQHKYYRGRILKSIAHFWGEQNEEAVHFKIKKMFLLKKITHDELNEVEPRHLNSKTVFFKESILDEETGEIEDKITSYIPSTANLEYEEFDDFIKKCEEFLIVELNGHIMGDQDEIAKEKINMMGDRIC